MEREGLGHQGGSPTNLRGLNTQAVRGPFADPRLEHLPILTLQPDSSSSESDFHPRPRPGRHSVSESQPERPRRAESPPTTSLSSFFLRRKKKSKSYEDFLGSDSDGDGPIARAPHVNVASLSLDDHRQVPHRQHGRSSSTATGKCMTCDTLVQWPADHRVFRCSTCMTVNDVRPIQEQSVRAPEPRLSTRSLGQRPEIGPRRRSSYTGKFHRTMHLTSESGLTVTYRTALLIATYKMALE
jgi:LSD1 subclass zinc finger protein